MQKSSNNNENAKEKKEKLLIPKYDIVFHSLFHNHRKELTSKFISAILKNKVKVVNMDKDRHLIKQYPDEKLGILDLRAELEDKTFCNIEIQLVKQEYIIERILYYTGRVISEQLKAGEIYSKVQKTIMILIADYELEILEGIEEAAISNKIFTDNKAHRMLTRFMEWIIIEIPKAKRILKENPNDEIAQWMMFLDNPNSKEVSKIMSENQEIKEAVCELEKISQNKELRRLSELKEKYIRDEKSVREGAREFGLKEGWEKGIEEGIKKGKEEGIQEGKEQSQKEIIIKMLNQKFDINIISEITEAPIEKIEEIQKSLTQN